MSNPDKPCDYKTSRTPVFIGILRFACLKEGTALSESDHREFVALLNLLPNYVNTHWRLIPLINDKAKRFGIFSMLDANVQNLLKIETQKGIIRELGKKKQLEEIVRVLTAKNISIILLKGTAFSNKLYDENAPRLSNDLDILIKESDWELAVKEISNLMSYKEKRIPGILGDAYELSFIPHGKIGSALDLHLSLAHPLLLGFSSEELWKSSVIHPYYNMGEVRTLSTEHILIHQALHAYKDLDFINYGAVDSFELIYKNEINFNSLYCNANKLGLENIVYYYFKTISLCIKNTEFDDCSPFKPNKFRLWLMSKLATLQLNTITNSERSIKYRFIQVLSQFTFFDSPLNVLRFQYHYVKVWGRNFLRSFFTICD